MVNTLHILWPWLVGGETLLLELFETQPGHQAQ